MQSASYSAAEAARLLRVSIPTLKQMCATGEIPHFKTPGGHLRILVDGLESIQGKAGRLTTSTPSSVLQSRRERVEELNLEGQELRSQRELRKLRNEDAAEAEQRRAENEARQQESQRRAQADAQERIDRFKREAQERQEHAELELIAEFRERWFQVAESKADRVDRLSAEQRKQLLDALEVEINKRGPADEARMEMVLTRTIKAVVEPWDCEWRREDAEQAARQVGARAMERLLWQFPYQATDSERAEAMAAMQAALGSLPASTPEPELVRVARKALDPVRQQVERRLMAERVLQWAVGQLPWLGRTEVNEARLRRGCREILVRLPADAVEQEMKAAVESLVGTACREIKERKANEEMAARKTKLIEDAKLQVFLYMGELANEEVISNEELWDSKLRKDLERTVEQELRAKLSGEEAYGELRQLVRQVVDDELEIEEEEEED